MLAAPDIAIPVAVSTAAFFRLTFPVVIFCSIKFDPNDVAASIATFATMLPIPNVATPTAHSTNFEVYSRLIPNLFFRIKHY